MEFTVTSGVQYIIGFAENHLYSYNRFTHGLQFVTSNSTVLAREGSADGVNIASFQPGDVFRISREGSSMKYYKNGTVLRTVSVSSAAELKVKGILLTTGTSTPNITTSFDSQLVVYGSVTSTGATSNTGAVSLNVSGGTTPYTYSWSSNESTSSINNKPQGTYTVTITDSVGRTLVRSFTIGYEVDWINLSGVTNNAGILTRTAVSGNSGAITSNLLAANTNGWIEFVGINGHDFLMGLTVNGAYSYSQYTSCIGLDNETGRATAFETNGTSTNLGSFQTGDVFRISREGGSVKYYRNGVVIRTISVSASLELRVKAVIFDAGNTTARVTTSFDSQLVVYGGVTGLDGNSGATGSIALSVVGGAPPYTYNWTSGENTSALNSKARGIYTVTVGDSAGRTQTRTYNIGYKANWINLVGVTYSNGRLTKTVQDNNWTSGAISSNLLPANQDGWIEVVPINGQNFRIGLASNDVINYTQFTASIFIDNEQGRAMAVEGSNSTSLGNFQTGDVFRISREGSVVKYYRNDVVLRTVSVSAALVLKVKASLLIPGTNTALVNASFWLSDGVVRTYYSIANGNWTTPSTWSLTENGPPSTVYPDDIDKVVIKGHEVTVNSDVKSAGVTITSTDENTKLKVDGNMAVLNVKGNILMNRENNENAEVLVIQNNGRLDVK